MTPETPPISFPRHGKIRSIVAGFKRKCPSCEAGKIFSGYLKLAEECSNCAAPIGQIRADDFPPYLTIFITAHIIVPALVIVEVNYQPPVVAQMIFWAAAAIVISLALLPVLKGGVVGFMWSIGMKGDEQH